MCTTLTLKRGTRIRRSDTGQRGRTLTTIDICDTETVRIGYISSGGTEVVPVHELTLIDPEQNLTADRKQVLRQFR